MINKGTYSVNVFFKIFIIMCIRITDKQKYKKEQIIVIELINKKYIQFHCFFKSPTIIIEKYITEEKIYASN